MSQNSSFILNDITNNLFHHFCMIKDENKPKIKEIITMSAKNLIDLTKCLIELHECINGPRYKHLNIEEHISYEMEAWHNEIIATGLAQRRNLSRMMSELKFMMSNIEGTGDLFDEMDEITKPIKQNWKPELCLKTGDSLREILLDLVLIVDPQIKANSQIPEDDFELIQRRISEMGDKSKFYLNNQPSSKQMLKSKSMSVLSQNIYEQIIPEEDVKEEETPRSPIQANEPFVVKEDTSKQGNCSGLTYSNIGSTTYNLSSNHRLPSALKKNKSQKNLVKINNMKKMKGINTQSEPNLLINLNKKNSTGRFNLNEEKVIVCKDLMKAYNLPLKNNISDNVVISNPTNACSVTPSPKSHHSKKIKSPNLKIQLFNTNTEVTKTQDSKTSFAFSNQTFFGKSKPGIIDFKNKGNHHEEQKPMIIISENYIPNKENFKAIPNSKNMVQINFNSKDTFGLPTTNNNSKENTQRDLTAPNKENNSINITLENLNTEDHNDSLSMSQKPSTQSPKIEIIDESLNKNIFDLDLDSEVKGESITGNFNSYLKEVENYRNILEEINKHQQESKLNSILIEEQSKGLLNSSKVANIELGSIQTDISELSNMFKVKKSREVIHSSRENLDSMRSNTKETFTNRQAYVINNGNIFDKTPRGENQQLSLQLSTKNLSSSEYTVMSCKFETHHKLKTRSMHLKKSRQNMVIGESCSPQPKKEEETYQSGTTQKEYDSELRKIPQTIDSNTPVRYSSAQEEDQNLEAKKLRLVKESKFDMKEFLSGRDSEKIHINFEGVEKLVLSNDGDYLIFGGQGLHVLDMSGNHFRMIRYDRGRSKKNIF